MSAGSLTFEPGDKITKASLDACNNIIFTGKQGFSILNISNILSVDGLLVNGSLFTGQLTIALITVTTNS